MRKGAPKSAFISAGAAGRDVILKYGHNIDTARATLDVDLAFALKDWGAYEALRELLLESGRFVEEPRENQCVRHKGAGKSRVDLIPFAGVEDDKRLIAWPPDGSHVMNMVGFREAAASAVTVILPNGQEVEVVSLPALMLLKLAAWKDRRLQQPGKDAQDIRLLLRTYMDAGNEERLYAEAVHLLEEEHFDYERAGAWLLGHDARGIATVKGSPVGSHDYFRSLLRTEIKAAEESVLLGDMRSTSPATDLMLLRPFAASFDT